MIHGNFPEQYLLKAFNNEAYMEDFINHGKLRMRVLQYYRTIEDRGRADKTEGEAHIQVPGTVEKVVFFPGDPGRVEVHEEDGLQQHHIQLGNPVYIFCASQASVDSRYLIRKFGSHLVQITNPKQLAADILSFLPSIPEINANQIEGHAVKYSHGQVVKSKPERNEFTTLSYIQKPKSYSPECEFRYAVVSKEPPLQRVERKFIDINLNRPLSYASIFSI